MEKVLPYIALGTSILGVGFTYFAFIVRILERLKDVETKVGLFWTSIEKSIPALLKSYPTNMEKDVLLDKMARAELTLEEAYRLRTILIEEARSDREKAVAYALAVARLEQVIYDLKRKVCK